MLRLVSGLALLLTLAVLTACEGHSPGATAPSSSWSAAPPATSPDHAPVTSRDRPPPDPRHRALHVIRAWDERRSAAFAAGDEAGVRRLYPPGSSLARADLELLRAYERRDARLLELTHQVREVTLRPSAPGSLRVEVVERLRSTVSVDGEQRALPTPTYRSTTLGFVRTGTRWRLSSASAG